MMFANNNDKVVTDLVQSLITVIEQGDFNGILAKISRLGRLSTDQIEFLKGLSEEEKRRVLKSGHKLLSITINRRNIDIMCALLKDDRARDALIQRLVVAHAPQRMMYDYFGISIAEMAALRRTNGVFEKGGRPISLTEDEERQVYSMYKLKEHRFKASCQQYENAVLCLHIHEQTGIPVASIYKFILEMTNV